MNKSITFSSDDSSRLEFCENEPQSDDEEIVIEVGSGFNGESFADSNVFDLDEFGEIVSELIKFNEYLKAKYKGHK
jgi:hypothetical protein